jgi:hypothetical protein
MSSKMSDVSQASALAAGMESMASRMDVASTEVEKTMRSIAASYHVQVKAQAAGMWREWEKRRWRFQALVPSPFRSLRPEGDYHCLGLSAGSGMAARRSTIDIFINVI